MEVQKRADSALEEAEDERRALRQAMGEQHTHHVHKFEAAKEAHEQQLSEAQSALKKSESDASGLRAALAACASPLRETLAGME